MTDKIAESFPTKKHPARRQSAHTGVRASEIAVGVVIGRTSEFFDFFVYAIASVLVFPKIIFPSLPILTATLYIFCIFALGFVARPIGTVIFNAVESGLGRSTKMICALFLLGTSTVAVAFLPPASDIGPLAALLLAVCRIGQGLAWGGSWDGLPSLLAVNAPAKRRGWYTMIPQLGAMIGLFVATALFIYFITHLSAEDFLDWGWRYPFFVAFAINVVALFARLRIVSTPEYTELFQTKELTPSPTRETLREQWRNIVLGAFAPLASFALFHMVTVFPLSWVFIFTPQSPAKFLTIEMVGAFIGGLCIIASGWLSDKLGRRTLVAGTAAIIGAFSGFAPQLLNGGTAGEIAYMVLGFILLGFSFGQSSGIVAANFPSKYRFTGSALTSDLAWLFGAGFAPFTALWISSSFGLPLAGAYLLSGAGCTGAALVINRRLARQS